MPRRKKPDKPTPRGGALRYLRTSRGVPEKELARREGVSPSVITELEHGARELTRERLDELLAHLEVPPEAADAALLARELTELPPPPASPVDPTEEEYRAFHRAAIHAAGVTLEAIRSDLVRIIRERRMALDRRQAGELWEEVKALKPGQRRQVLIKEPRFWAWAFAERLCEESRRMAAHSADRALELAELAVEVAQRAAVPESWRPFLLGYCWGFIGNARRVKGTLSLAEEAFQVADRFWQAGAPSEASPLEKGNFLILKASLRQYQERFEEAASLLQKALASCTSEQTQIRVQMKQAITFEMQGDHENAIRVLQKLVDVVQAKGGQRDLFGVQFNLAVNLCLSGKAQKAESLIPGLADIAAGLRNDLDMVRVLWLRGKVDARLGRSAEAMVTLEQVRMAFIEHEIAYDAAIVSLELAELWLDSGHIGRVKDLAEGLSWIVQRRELHGFALAALQLFCEAAGREMVTEKLVNRVRRFLEKARYNPQLRFDNGK